MKKFLVVAGALALASALPAAQSEDSYYWYHEAIGSTSLTDQVPMFDKSLADHPEHVASVHGKGVVFYRRGDLNQAIEVFESELKSSKDPGAVQYDLACCYSLKGNKGEAVEHLQKAVRSGFSDWTLMRADKDLDPIRDEPQVARLMKGHRSRRSSAKAGEAAKSSPAAAGAAAPTASGDSSSKKPKKVKARKGKRGKQAAGEAKPAAAEAKPAAAPSAADFDSGAGAPAPPASAAPAAATPPSAAAPAKAKGK